MSCLYILEINLLPLISFAIIFSHSEGCLFTLLIISFAVQKPLSLIRSHLFTFVFIYVTLGGGSRRRQWHPTPVLFPGKSHGWRSLVGCSPWGRQESDTTEQPHFWLFTFMHWRRKWQPTPVFLPGESQGLGILVGCRLWGRKETDTTELLNWTELMVVLFLVF